LGAALLSKQALASFEPNTLNSFVYKEKSMGILSWIIVGLIAGWLAGEMMRGSGFGVVGNIIVGIVGSLLGGFLATALFNVPDPLTGINFTTIIIAFLGSVVLLALLRLLRGSRV
jgi:uncharacterized membrane protein YeaQ/YmgE (transglycosylase-associated protein family)